MPPWLSRRLAQLTNEGVAGLVEQHPHRLVGLGTVPLQHPELAVAELTRAVDELGLRGVQVGTLAGSRELADDALDGFWARAEELDAVVFVHPWGCSLGERLDRYYLSNTVGNPVETAVALSHLVFSGLLDRRPGVRIAAAHGGGYLSHVPGPRRPCVAGTARGAAPGRTAEHVRAEDVVRLPGLYTERTSSPG